MDLSMANQKNKTKKILKIELLFFFKKFTASKHESLITKKKREEQRDKWIPFGRRSVREGGRLCCCWHDLTRARPYSWTGISHEGSETLNLGKLPYKQNERTKERKKKKTGEEEERSDFSRKNRSDISYMYNGRVMFFTCITVGCAVGPSLLGL